MKMSVYHACCLCVFVVGSLCSAEDLLGVHGVVRVGSALMGSRETNLKLTQVHVELHTPSGVRLSETDCAPNGYFFLPVSKPGKYIVKPKGFQGWSFTPSQKIVECLAKNCNSGRDLIFEVNGFSISGTILISEVAECDKQENPALDAIRVTLRPENGEVLLSLQCSKDGSFSFDGVMPGEYRVHAEHPRWELLGPSNGIAVSLGWESVVIKRNYKVAGFGVNGRVEWRKQPIENVVVNLYLPVGDSDIEKSNLTPMGTTKTDSEGSFSFEDIQCGRFVILPSSDLTDGMSYTFSPSIVEIHVPLGDLEISKPLEISSFSVLGTVVHKSTNKGIKDVEVRADGQATAMTSEDGSYILHNIQRDKVDLGFKKDGFAFSKIQGTKVGPLTNTIAAISPTGYSVCGSVIGKQTDRQMAYILQLTKESGVENTNAELGVATTFALQEVDTAKTDAEGEFCLVLEPGSYTLEVQGPVVFAPKSRKIQVVDSPLSNIKFVQKKVNLGVSVKKLPSSDWGTITIVLAAVDEDMSKRMTLRDMTIGDEDTYIGSFVDISPGDYQLKITRDAWCWREQQMDVSLGEDDYEAPAFQQTGLEKKLMMTHGANLKFEGPGTEFITDGFYQGGKVHILCFSSAAVHTINAEEHGCYVFNRDMVIDPSDPATLAISAAGFKASGKIKLPNDVQTTEITMHIKSKTTGQIQDISARPAAESGEMVFEFTGILGEHHEISPEHETLLFHPEKLDYSHSGVKCAPETQPFWAKHGTFVVGEIKPPVEGALVRLKLEEEVLEQTTSSPSGSFSFGPYYEVNNDCALSVEKQGFEFVVRKTDEKSFSVSSVRLVKVEVAIDMRARDRSGVLVSLVGTQHGHRSNGQTIQEGVVTFWKLPADSYYIKPMLKEYAFDPPFLQIEVDGTQDDRITFSAKRTGFSAYGNITSLNKQILPDVSVVARSSDDEESCISDEQGLFRLQNLKPKVEYTISVMIVSSVRAAWPTSKKATIQHDSRMNDFTDLKNINFVVFKHVLLNYRVASHGTLECRDDGTVSVTGVVDVDSAQIPFTEVQVAKTVRSDGGTRLVSTLKPYFNGWLEIDLPFPGKYTFKVVNKELESSCHMPSTTVLLDANAPTEVYIGELRVDCTAAGGKENVDYASSSYWPVLVTLVAIIAVPLRNVLRGIGMPSE